MYFDPFKDRQWCVKVYKAEEREGPPLLRKAFHLCSWIGVSYALLKEYLILMCIHNKSKIALNLLTKLRLSSLLIILIHCFSMYLLLAITFCRAVERDGLCWSFESCQSRRTWKRPTRFGFTVFSYSSRQWKHRWKITVNVLFEYFLCCI